MTGQNIQAKRLVVLAEDEEGRQVGWDVFDVSEMSWRWTGVDANGSRARIVVEGSFHRIGRTPDDPLQMAFDGMREIESELPELKGGSDGG